jgi:hypothetical protein
MTVNEFYILECIGLALLGVLMAILRTIVKGVSAWVTMSERVRSLSQALDTLSKRMDTFEERLFSAIRNP